MLIFEQTVAGEFNSEVLTWILHFSSLLQLVDLAYEPDRHILVFNRSLRLRKKLTSEIFGGVSSSLSA